MSPSEPLLNLSGDPLADDPQAGIITLHAGQYVDLELRCCYSSNTKDQICFNGSSVCS